MMKTFSAYAIFSLCAVSAFAQGAGMKQYKSINGKDWVCTTNAVTLTAAEAALRVAGDVAGSNNVTALSGTVTALSGGVTASNALFNAWFAGIFPQTNNWNAAFGWGDWSASVASNTAAIVVLQTNAVPVAATNGWTVTSHDGFLTNETDAAAMAALAGKKFTLWYDPEDTNRWAVWDGGTNIVIYKATVTGTNFVVTHSEYFCDNTYEAAPDCQTWETSEFPFQRLPWTGTMTEGLPTTLSILGTDTAHWSATTSTFPVDLLPQNAASIGTATVSIASFNLATNIEYRYFLPTNAIPPELANLDNLQGWLNNLYAMKSVVDGHINNGTHTNVTFAGTVTIGGVTRTDWPVGATNLVVGATSVPYDTATQTFDGTGILFPVTSGTATNPSFIGSATLNGQPLLTNAPPGATMTYLTNSFGVTTQQVWTIGGAVSTNFFTSKALVPKTGQTNVYYETGCDGCLKIGFPLPSPRFSLVADTGPATNQVLDNLTGLIWCRDAGRTPTNWVSIFEAVSNMNVEAYAGATDWRLPNVREMLSLIHFGFSGPAISSLLGSSKGSAGDPFFGVSLVTGYATSTTRSANTTHCFTCGLYDGTIGVAAKTSAFGYIPVRGP